MNPPTEQEPIPAGPLLEHLLINQDEHGKGSTRIGEHQLVEQHDTTEAVRDLHRTLEHVVLNTAPKDVQRIQIVPLPADEGPPADLAPEDTDKALGSLWRALRGPVGPQGPKGEKGETGAPGADSTVAGPTGPQGPRGEAGKDGKDGLNGKDGRDGADGKNGADGKPGKNGKSGSPDTGSDIIAKIKGLLTYDLIPDAPTREEIASIARSISSRDYAVAELTDVDLSGIQPGQSLTWDGKRLIPYTPAASGTAVYGEVVSGSATSFTLAHTPLPGTLRLYGVGQRLDGASYANVGPAITTSDSWAAGSLMADYSY